jgi:hypothetical protein
MRHALRRIGTVALLLQLAACQPAANGGPDEVSASSREIFSKYSVTWNQPVITVCFEPLGLPNHATEAEWIREAVTDSWQANSTLAFSGWFNCNNTPTANIRIFIAVGNNAAGTKFLGTGGNQVPNNVKISDYNVPGLCEEPGFTRKDCVQTDAVHEFGHVLSWAHEQTRPDTPPVGQQGVTQECLSANQGGSTEVGTLTAPPGAMEPFWDLHSVMNYCNPVRMGKGDLSGTDIQGLVDFYPTASVPVLFYKQQNGWAATGRIDPHFSVVGNIGTGLSSGWTHAVALKNRMMFFYNSSQGLGFVSRLDPWGNYTDVAYTQPLPTGFTHVTAVHNGFILFYNRNTGAIQVARTRNYGASFEVVVPPTTYVGTDWDQVAGLANGRVFYYRNSDGVGVIGKLDSHGAYHFTSDVVETSTTWTHVVGVRNNLFFYDRNSRLGSISTIDSNGNYWHVREVPNFADFTHVAGTRSGALFLYDANTGWAQASFITDFGDYFFMNLQQIASGWTHVTGG